MPDADLVIEVPLEPALEPKTEEKVVVAAEPEVAIEPVEDLKKQLKELTERQAADRAATEAARAEAQAARAEAAKQIQEVAKVKTELTESNVATVDNAILAAQSEADGHQRDQQAAFEAGDFAKAAEFGRKMAKAEARVGRLEEGKADLEFRKTQAPKVEPQTSPATSADPFEVSIAGATPRAQKWLRAHPTYVTDQSLNRKANIAHLKAVDEGFVVDSDAYFDFCEQELGLKEQPKPNGAANGGKQPSDTRTRSMPAAPVSRDTSPSGGNTATQVTLSPGEQARATDGSIVWNYNDPKLGAVKGQPVGLKEYARRKIAMTKQGAYDRSYTDQ